MMQTFAYEIAAAFFLAAILMGGSFLRGFFSEEILRAFKLAAIGFVLAGAGLWIYRNLPSGTSATPVGGPSASLPAASASQPRKARRADPLREADRKALAAAMAEEAAKPDIPVHIIEGGIDKPAPESSPENRGKRIVKSIGRALHIPPKPQP